MNPGERAWDLGYAAGWRLVRALPEGWARRLFDVAADRAARGGGPDQLRRNLARVLSTTPAQVPDDLVRDTSLVGPVGYVKERLAAYAAAGVTALLVSPLHPTHAERVRAVGGRITAGPGIEGGWVVDAAFPLDVKMVDQ